MGQVQLDSVFQQHIKISKIVQQFPSAYSIRLGSSLTLEAWPYLSSLSPVMWLLCSRDYRYYTIRISGTLVYILVVKSNFQQRYSWSMILKFNSPGVALFYRVTGSIVHATRDFICHHNKLCLNYETSIHMSSSSMMNTKIVLYIDIYIQISKNCPS